LRPYFKAIETLQKNKLKRGETLELTITAMAFGGNGIARMNTEQGELVVFVPNTIPGQLVRCRVDKVRKRHVETKLMEVLQNSPDEVSIPYQRISGAPYAALPVPLQENYKRETSIDLMRRIGHVADADERFDTLISSPSHWHYRNKMEYAFAAIRYDLETHEELDEFALGFKHRGTWWMVENLDKDSGLFDAQVEDGLNAIRKFCESTGLPAWHAPRREGFFRFLAVRKSYHNNGLLFNLVTSATGIETFDLDGFVALLKSIFAERLAGIMHTINRDTGDRVHPLSGSSVCIYGKDHITEVLHGIPFDISMQSFFQTNPKSAERLYTKAIDYLKEGTAEGATILDLFCGTGTIAQLIGRDFPNAAIVGVDIEEKAIADAIKAAAGKDNLRFYAADVGKFLLEHPQYVGKIDAIVLDPPRAGIAPKALKRTIELGAPCIVYISCNPATLARDVATLQESGYRLEKFSLVDQFPHTSHVEAVSMFKLK
jgi:23S rRNA (uracil-5-)-methyltransferase RumA